MKSTVVEIPEKFQNDCIIWLVFDGEGEGTYSLRRGESQSAENYLMVNWAVTGGDRTMFNLGIWNETITVETTDNLEVSAIVTGGGGAWYGTDGEQA